MTDRFQTPGSFIPYGIALALLALAFLVPPLRMILLMVVGTLVPVPLVLLSLQRGRNVGLITITAVSVVLWLLLGPAMAIGFLAMYGVTAAAMAESTRLSFPFERIIVISTLAPTVLVLVILFAGFAGEGESSFKMLEDTVRITAESSLKSLKEAGESPARIAEIRKSVNETLPTLVRAIPAILLTGFLMAAVINFLVVRFLWRKFYSQQYFEGVDISRWMLPDIMVWVLIASIGSLFLGMKFSQIAGMNLAIICLYLYLLQGLAVVVHILKTKAFPKWVWIIVFVLIPLNPMFMGLVIGIGLFDIWVDFRKLRVTAPPDSGESPE